MTAQYLKTLQIEEVEEVSSDIPEGQYTQRVFVVEVIDQDGNTYNNN